MAAPTPTARGTPAGIMLERGFKCLITHSSNPAIKFKEKAVKPSGIDGGEPIPTSTMHNTEWHTMARRILKKGTPSTAKCAYDPDIQAAGQVAALLNQDGIITETYSDGTTRCYYGYFQKWDPDEHVEDPNQPTATLTIIPTMWDYINHVEAGPVVTSVAGT